MGFWMPRRNSTCAASSWRVRSPHHRKCALQSYLQTHRHTTTKAASALGRVHCSCGAAGPYLNTPADAGHASQLLSTVPSSLLPCRRAGGSTAGGTLAALPLHTTSFSSTACTLTNHPTALCCVLMRGLWKVLLALSYLLLHCIPCANNCRCCGLCHAPLVCS